MNLSRISLPCPFAGPNLVVCNIGSDIHLVPIFHEDSCKTVSLSGCIEIPQRDSFACVEVERHTQPQPGHISFELLFSVK